MRRRRRALDESARRSAAEAAALNTTRLPGWDRARRIALYLASDGEIDTTPLVLLCRRSRKQLYLPVIQADDSLLFRLWTTDSALASNRFGIPEPPADAPRCPATELDVVILPLVAWDRNGGRLGMGGGFYDRTLAATPGPVKVGLAHAVQETTRIPQDEWDVTLDFVATDDALHCCRVATGDNQS